jgi:RNA polymerase sigma-70 factor (ECF subfamily)
MGELQKSRIELDAFVRNYQARAYAHAYWLTGNRADAQDLVQESFARLTAYWEHCETTRRIDGLFVAIMRNAFIDSRRTRKPLCSLDAPRREELTLHDVLPCPDPDVLDELIREETIREVRKCLKKLRPSYRHVLTRADMEAEPYEAIAAELQVPMGTMKSRLFRARESFRKHASAFGELT